MLLLTFAKNLHNCTTKTTLGIPNVGPLCCAHITNLFLNANIFVRSHDSAASQNPAYNIVYVLPQIKIPTLNLGRLPYIMVPRNGPQN